MRPRPTEMLRRLTLLALLALCGNAWASDCAYSGHEARAGGTGIGGTGTMAQGTGIGGTGIQLGVFRSDIALAGNVLAIEGEVRAEINGNGRALAKGDPVCTGDKITTSASSSLRLQMADGGLLTLRPQTQLRIEKFAYRGTNKDNSLLVLDKGACRIVTGNIGKQHPENDLLRTPHATIGIREADHEAAVILPQENKDYPAGTYDKVNHGAAFLSTAQGEVSIHPDQAGFSAGGMPTLLQEIPAFYRAENSPR